MHRLTIPVPPPLYQGSIATETDDAIHLAVDRYTAGGSRVTVARMTVRLLRIEGGSPVGHPGELEGCEAPPSAIRWMLRRSAAWMRDRSVRRVFWLVQTEKNARRYRSLGAHPVSDDLPMLLVVDIDTLCARLRVQPVCKGVR